MHYGMGMPMVPYEWSRYLETGNWADPTGIEATCQTQNKTALIVFGFHPAILFSRENKHHHAGVENMALPARNARFATTCMPVFFVEAYSKIKYPCHCTPMLAGWDLMAVRRWMPFKQ